MPAKDKAAIGQAVTALRAGRHGEAERLLNLVLKRHPSHLLALSILGALLTSQGKFADAEPILRSALKISPNSDDALYNYGIALRGLSRPAEALEQFNKTIALKPSSEKAWLAKGRVLHELGRHDGALEAFHKAKIINPASVEAWLRYGNVAGETHRRDEALRAFDKALAIKSNLEGAWLGRGNIYLELGRHEEAFAAYDKALAFDPRLAAAWNGRGNTLFELKRYDEALVAYDRATALKADFADPWYCRGNTLIELKRYDEALAAYDMATALNADFADPWYGRGSVYSILKRYAEAAIAFGQAVKLNPNLKYAEGARLHSKQYICDWTNLESEWKTLLGAMRAGTTIVEPFASVAGPTTLADQRVCAKIYTANQWPPGIAPVWRGERYSHDRIRVGYLSADFRSHPVAQAVAELLERHDRSRFEILGLSIGSDDGSEIRARIVKALDQFHDIRMKSDAEAARLIKELEVDVLVKVAPHTEGSRLGILAHRPAPIQVNGFSAWTSGAAFIDYVLADQQTLPFDEQPHFSEQIVHLPVSYFPHDSTQQIAASTPSRAEAGLPDNAFVFCSFNRSYKLNPRTFDIWMRLLKRVDRSVLWLMQDNDQAAVNLRREAALRDIDPSRLIFASWTPLLSDHLARHRLANLFLDTLPFGAHTTAKDALWAGLPVLTCRGDTFVGRIAASQLHAVGLPDLVADSLDEYEAAALRLTQNPHELCALRDRLAGNRLTHALFDTTRLCQHFEAAYIEMLQRYRRGEPPKSFAVERQYPAAQRRV